MYLVDGLKQTIFITLIAALMGILIGTLIALIKVAARGNRKLRPLEWIANLYLTVIRGTPMVVQLMIMYYLILTSADKVTAAIVAFGINSGAYVAELVRSGILSVDGGQTEAGRSLGLPQRTVMTRIVFPQALKIFYPRWAMIHRSVKGDLGRRLHRRGRSLQGGRHHPQPDL